MARKRRPMTPEQRERKRQRDREYYARKRADAGLSYQPKTPIQKTAETVASKLLDAAKSIISPIDATPKKRKRKRERPPVPGVSFGSKTRKETESFERFVQLYPELSAKKVIELYRQQTGQSISNKLGYQRVREVRDAGKQYEKVRFKMYGPDDHPAKNKKFLFPKRYMYLVRYGVEVDGQPETYEQYTYIKSDRLLSPSQIAQAAIDEFTIGQEVGKERYIAKRIDPNSVTILWGVDRFKKSAS